MPAPLEIRVLPVTAEAWTPVVVPFDCSSIAIKNSSEGAAVFLRTDPQDSSTEDVLCAGREQAFAVPFHRYRFLAASQPLWMKASAGNVPVVVKFLA